MSTWLSFIWTFAVWGLALVFRRLWEMLGLSDTMNKVSASSQITFSADEAAFAMVLHRLEDPGSKRELYRHWLKTVYRPAFDELQPQHFYRTLDLLAENKDRIETALFEKARDLFTLRCGTPYSLDHGVAKIR